MTLPVPSSALPGPMPTPAVRVRPRPSGTVARPHRTITIPVPRTAGEWLGALAVLGVGAAVVAALALAVLVVALLGGVLVAGSAALVSHLCRPRGPEIEKEDHRDDCY